MPGNQQQQLLLTIAVAGNSIIADLLAESMSKTLKLEAKTPKKNFSLKDYDQNT